MFSCDCEVVGTFSVLLFSLSNWEEKRSCGADRVGRPELHFLLWIQRFSSRWNSLASLRMTRKNKLTDAHPVTENTSMCFSNSNYLIYFFDFSITASEG